VKRMATRFFLAIPLNDDVRGSVADWLRGFEGPDVWRWTASENLHITVRFYGAVADGRIPELTRVLRDKLGGLAPFTMTLDRIEAAPPPRAPARGKLRPPTMLWGMFSDGEPYERLTALVEEASGRFAEPSVSLKGAIPHVTIARLKNGMDASLPAVLPLPKRLPLSVAGCLLFSSRLTPSGPEYQPIADFPFAAV